MNPHAALPPENKSLQAPVCTDHGEGNLWMHPQLVQPQNKVPLPAFKTPVGQQGMIQEDAVEQGGSAVGVVSFEGPKTMSDIKPFGGFPKTPSFQAQKCGSNRFKWVKWKSQAVNGRQSCSQVVLQMLLMYLCRPAGKLLAPRP